MQSMRANAHAENLVAFEAAGHEIVLNVLDSQQVANWVVSAP